MPRSQKMGQKQIIKIEKRFFEYLEKFIYMGRKLVDQNYMEEEIKMRIIRRMLATILFRVFRLSACCLGM
jgi:hypothetical protein